MRFLVFTSYSLIVIAEANKLNTRYTLSARGVNEQRAPVSKHERERIAFPINNLASLYSVPSWISFWTVRYNFFLIFLLVARIKSHYKNFVSFLFECFFFVFVFTYLLYFSLTLCCSFDEKISCTFDLIRWVFDMLSKYLMISWESKIKNLLWSHTKNSTSTTTKSGKCLIWVSNRLNRNLHNTKKLMLTKE